MPTDDFITAHHLDLALITAGCPPLRGQLLAHEGDELRLVAIQWRILSQLEIAWPLRHDPQAIVFPQIDEADVKDKARRLRAGRSDRSALCVLGRYRTGREARLDDCRIRICQA